MHCEIIDHHFNKFFTEIQLKKENWKSDFWMPKFGCPNLDNGLQVECCDASNFTVCKFKQLLESQSLL